MATDNNSNAQSGSDVVKSQIASAYEDGVDGYGDVPPTTTIPEKVHVIEATNTYDEHGPYGGNPPETSPDINLKRIQTIASLLLSDKEMERMKELIQARFLEDSNSAAIVELILSNVESFGSEDNLENINTLKQARPRNRDNARVFE